MKNRKTDSTVFIGRRRISLDTWNLVVDLVEYSSLEGLQPLWNNDYKVILF